MFVLVVVDICLWDRIEGASIISWGRKWKLQWGKKWKSIQGSNLQRQLISYLKDQELWNKYSKLSLKGKKRNRYIYCVCVCIHMYYSEDSNLFNQTKITKGIEICINTRCLCICFKSWTRLVVTEKGIMRQQSDILYIKVILYKSVFYIKTIIKSVTI